ncbi:MAG TPA: DUF1178 family protein [Bauldia sp.]|nr:DUF1178 family protein [Bauldia sp.]
MIRYALNCDKGHSFEAWFRSMAEYERLEKAGENACPMCRSVKTAKAIMAPAVARTDSPPAAVAGGEPVQLASTHDPKQKAMLAAMRELRRKIIENADNVGDRFAEEARKIHYRETEARGIYGAATPDEAKKLIEEGIDFAPLPPVPEDHN